MEFNSSPSLHVIACDPVITSTHSS